MKKVRFIVNPFSGANRKRSLPDLVEKYLDNELYEPDVAYTEYAGHAIELAREAVDEGYYMVVACGGDGSVNEIASQLIETETILGVLPCGSGNGFAMHLGLGRDVAKAIRHLNNGKCLMIDSCRMNDKPFVNLAGVGFDAVVANRLHGSKLRGFFGYFRSTLLEVFRYKLLDLEIRIDEKVLHRTCLLTEVANAPIYGYGFSVVPPARFNDGKLEILIVNKAPKWRYLLELWRFFNHSFHKSPLVECYTGKHVLIKPSVQTAVHIDGEGFDLNGEAHFSIQPLSLKVMCPKAYAEILGSAQDNNF